MRKGKRGFWLRVNKWVFSVGIIFSSIFITRTICYRYSDPEIKIGDYYEKMGVDILKNDSEIIVVDNKSGHIIFELSKDKAVDAPFYSVIEDILIESSGKEAYGKPSVSYRKRG